MAAEKFDDASWHYGADDFPAHLPPEAGATHTGLFVAWALTSGLAGSIHIEDFPENIPMLEQRQVTPGVFFLESCDGKFTDEDLNETGLGFAKSYFDLERGRYLEDYEAVLGSDVADLYAIADTWENFDKLKPVLDQRFREWQAGQG